MSKTHEEFRLLSSVHKLRRTNHKDFQNYLSACFLSQMDPKKPVQALKDPSWVEAMQDELLQFKLLKVWTLVDLPKDKWAIGTKRVYRNKKDKRGTVIKNKARLVAQGHTQEEDINYNEVFAPIARIEAIRLFLAYASFKNFVVYQMDVNSAFLYRKIEEEVYVCQPPGFEDLNFPDKVYKSGKGSLWTKSSPKSMKSDGIFISQDKYVAEVLKKFNFVIVKTATSRPDITFAVCACAMFQVTPKTSHLHAVKRIFRYLKGQSKLGLWYPKDSPFDLEAYFDSGYTGSDLDMKSTTGGCQFLGKRLISWQCKKQTIVANSINKAEYVAAANCCGHVLWIQNQMLDYGFNLINIKIYIDNESTICIVKNQVFHSKTKHIEIRHHFTRDYYEKKLIQVIKIHTDKNVADLLTKAFDVSRKQKPRRKQRKEAEVSHDESQDKEHIPTPFSDPLPSGEDSFTLNELMVFLYQLTRTGLRRLKKIGSGRRVKSPMEKDSLGAQEDASKQRRIIEEIDQNAEITLDDETQGRTNNDDMFGVDDLADKEVVMDTTTSKHVEQIIKDVEKEVKIVERVTIAGEVVTTTTVKVSAAPTTDVTEDEITMAQALAGLKSVKPKVMVQEAKGIVFHKQKQEQIPTVSSSMDKGKAKMIEPKVPIKRKDQMNIDKEYARKLEAKEQEAARLRRAQQDEKANISWDNIQAMMDADRLLAEMLQARERIL
nr:putative ribonuclease H-like domain-containing protein [Tanacetum cinerariifolium]